jgi:sugar O-acyltransferase (sialic acid O-acetyltransferase NeuD family)
MSQGVIVLGGGGHAKVLIDALQHRHVNIVGYTTTDGASTHLRTLGIPFLGDDQAVQSYSTESVELVLGVGSIGSQDIRQRLFERFGRQGYRFANVIHPFTMVSNSTRLGSGVQVMAGAIIQIGTEVGINTIVNTRATIDHDCVIGSDVHIAPGVTLCGGVHVGNGSHIGVSATIVQGVHIGAQCVIGAGAVVLKDVPDGAVVYGVPGKEIAK